jgi:hypothetical protein
MVCLLFCLFSEFPEFAFDLLVGLFLLAPSFPAAKSWGGGQK